MKIKTIKKTASNYKIILENNDAITTYDDIILKYNILYKKEITSDLLEKILEENKYYETFNKIIKYIKTKQRSEYEIKKYMDKLDITNENQSKMLTKLKQIKLIDDEKYTKAYIHDKITLTNDGPEKIKKDLIKLKIQETLITNELENIDQTLITTKLEKQILKKIKANTKYSKEALRQKLLNYFINLGYEKQQIIAILENNPLKDTDIIKKEYQKLYNKLHTKYEEKELKRIIKQKLYQKGFNYEDINNLIEN